MRFYLPKHWLRRSLRSLGFARLAVLGAFPALGWLGYCICAISGSLQPGWAAEVDPPAEQTAGQTTGQAAWKPAPAPLMTRWGRQVNPENPWPEYPRPQLVRRLWLNLNGLWDYAITPRQEAPPQQWAGKILVPYPIESALSGVGKSVEPDQHLWYRRHFEVPAAWKGQRIWLRFQAVDWEATVWLNGRKLGSHRGMSDPFGFDITDALRPGHNELIVRVWDPTDTAAQPRGKQVRKPHGIWYTAVTGIWQTVWLEPVPAGGIQGLHFTTDITRGLVTVHPQGLQEKDRYRVTVRLGSQTLLQQTAADSRPVTLRLEPPRLWTPDTPTLYDVTLEVLRGDEVIDRVESYFAFRSVSVGKDSQGLLRILLNGQPLFQLGTLDQGWWPDGLLTPPSDEAMRYDLEVLKQLGFNMLRKHIKVEPARYYYHCDRLGLLVWQDMPSGGVPERGHFLPPQAAEDARLTEEEKRQFRSELQAMIDHLRFFPCIVVWVPFNEGWGQHDTNDILRFVKTYDPTRLVDGPSGWADRGFGDLKDMHSYPGPAMFPPLPDRVSVLGEFGGLGLPVPGHLWKNTDNWGYRTYRTTEELRQHYAALIRRLHPLIAKGLAAAVYTQTTDVEVEVNGLLTYDRAVLKLDPEQTRRWHRALFGPLPRYREWIPTSEQAGHPWRYTLRRPAEGWEKPDFDDHTWIEGSGGFGTKGTPGAVVRTEWKTADIWLRGVWELKEQPRGELWLRIHHDEDAEVYLNGILAARLTGYTTDYVEIPLSESARQALRPGKNIVAVHCRQTRGGQYIDLGLGELLPAEK